MHFTQRAIRARMRRKLAAAILIAGACVGVSLGYAADNVGAAAAPYCSGHYVWRITYRAGYGDLYTLVCVH